MAQKDNTEIRAGRDLQHPLLPSVVCLILAVGAAMGAFFASGIFQVVFIILAVILAAYTVMLYLAGLLHSIVTMPKRRAHARRDRTGS